MLIGGEPRTEWLAPEIERSPHGYVLTGAELSGEPLALETSVPGIFAAGEGAMVVALVHQHLARPGMRATPA